MISVVFPVYNEKENISPFLKELFDMLSRIGKTYEIIAVDDGSRDSSFEELRRYAASESRLKIIRFARNFGQTAALAAGIAAAKGEIVVTIDSDLENDPADIPKLLAALEEGYDVVSGWRKERWGTQPLSRRIPSRGANWLISRISGLELHDYGCTLKAYRRSVISGVSLYGDMHRFIPAYLYGRGAKVKELAVRYRPRKFGTSKYGITRTFHVMLDLLFLKFLTTYMARPIHFFGGLGFLSLALGIAAGLLAVALKLTGTHTFVSTPLPVFFAFLVIVGIQFIVFGVLAEMLMRIYYEAQNKLPYQIKETVNV